MERIWKIITGFFRAIAWLALLVIIYVGISHAIKFWGGWPNFSDGLKEWSTLITGFLAVGAAYLTVHQMRKSDDLQVQLQKQALLNASYKERLAVRRLQNRLPNLCRQTAETLDKLFAFMTKELELGEPSWGPEKVTLAHNAVFATWHLRAELNEMDKEPVSLLFTPELDHEIARCLDLLTFFLIGVKAAPDMFRIAKDIQMNEAPDYFKHNMFPLSPTLAKLVTALSETCDRWAGEYTPIQAAEA